MTEHDLRARVSADLRDRRLATRRRLWYLKIHGSRFQRPGVPDYLVCWRGHLSTIELKTETTTLARRQELEREDLDLSGATTYVAHSWAEYQAVIRAICS